MSDFNIYFASMFKVSYIVVFCASIWHVFLLKRCYKILFFYMNLVFVQVVDFKNKGSGNHWNRFFNIKTEVDMPNRL